MTLRDWINDRTEVLGRIGAIVVAVLCVLLIVAACASCTSLDRIQEARWSEPDAVEASALRATSADAAAPAPAPVIRVVNLTPYPFSGWKRVNVDSAPPCAAGFVDGVRFVVGRQTGRDQWAVDLRVELAPFQERRLDMATVAPEPFTLQPPPADPGAHFGGVAAFAGSTLSFVSLRDDGAAWSALLRTRCDDMLVVDVWLRWYPDQPAWCHGELLLTASSAAVPDLVETIDVDTRLAFGDAIVVLPGAPLGARVLPLGDTLGDGQGRAVPFVLLWLRHLQAIGDFGSIAADAALGIGGHGVRTLLHQGNPQLPATFSARQWWKANYVESLRRLHTWNWALFGPNPVSGDTGAQEDQVFPRGEAMLPDGAGAELIAYAAALKLFERPFQLRELDGAPLNPAAHVSPRLLLWDSRVHWHPVVSPERWGKPRGLLAPTQLNPQGETHGRWGPDVEHMLYFGGTAAHRLTGSPCLQHLLRTLAVNYPLQQTVQAGWSTSDMFAARAIGWEAAMLVAFDRQLEDPQLRAATIAHGRARWHQIIRPKLDAAPGDRWDIRTDDLRLGPGAWWIPWQQSVGAYWLDVAGEALNEPTMRAIALRGALRVVEDAWLQDASGGWITQANHPVVGEPGAADGSFNYFGMPLAVACVLRHDPMQAKARAIWTWLQARCTTLPQFRWMAPECWEVAA